MKTTYLTACCSIALDLSTDAKHFVIIPEGIIKGIDGRTWTLSPERGRAIVASCNQQQIDMVLDYEHSTLFAKKSGTAAPASGWCRAGKFAYIDGVGVCSTDWFWTDRAAEQIKAKEYRYTSPMFLHSESGEVLALINAALTNTPNLDVLPEAMLAAASQMIAHSIQSLTTEDTTVDEILEQLRWMLNLPLSATAAEVSAELAKLQDRIKSETGVEVAANGKNLLQALDAYKDLAVAANSQAIPDPTKFAPIAVVTGLQAQVKALTESKEIDPVEPLIVAACSDGRLLASDTDYVGWIRNYGKTDFDGMKSMLDSMPKRYRGVVGKQTDTQLAANSRQHHQPNALDADALAIAEQMGNEPSEVAKYL